MTTIPTSLNTLLVGHLVCQILTKMGFGFILTFMIRIQRHKYIHNPLQGRPFNLAIEVYVSLFSKVQQLNQCQVKLYQYLNGTVQKQYSRKKFANKRIQRTAIAVADLRR